MVSIVANWTNIKGKVEHIGPHPSNAAYSLISIAVKSQKIVKGFTSLFEDIAGQVLICMVLTEALDKAKIREGSSISCDISKKPPSVFINPESVKSASK